MSVPQPLTLKPCLLPRELLRPRWWGGLSVYPCGTVLRDRKDRWALTHLLRVSSAQGSAQAFPAGSQVGQLSPPLTRDGTLGSDG